MSRDLKKVKTFDLLIEASNLLNETSIRIDLEREQRDCIVNFLDEIGGMIRTIENAEIELTESLETQDRGDGQRWLSENNKPQLSQMVEDQDY